MLLVILGALAIVGGYILWQHGPSDGFIEAVLQDQRRRGERVESAAEVAGNQAAANRRVGIALCCIGAVLVTLGVS
jgi:hypothetical protein